MFEISPNKGLGSNIYVHNKQTEKLQRWSVTSRSEPHILSEDEGAQSAGRLSKERRGLGSAGV